MNLDKLPYDVLFGISLFLDIEEVVHLGNTSPHLRILLEEETLCHRLVEVRLCQFVRISLDNINVHPNRTLQVTLWRPSLHRPGGLLMDKLFAGYTSADKHSHQRLQFQPL